MEEVGDNFDDVNAMFDKSRDCGMLMNATLNDVYRKLQASAERTRTGMRMQLGRMSNLSGCVMDMVDEQLNGRVSIETWMKASTRTQAHVKSMAMGDGNFENNIITWDFGGELGVGTIQRALARKGHLAMDMVACKAELQDHFIRVRLARNMEPNTKGDVDA